ncbi:MAG: GGDEF domain-containing protein, partial [Natronospirillum sp.]
GFNDRWGHEAGDSALMTVADSIRSVIRESDVTCRMGGDEFVLLLNGVSNREAAASVATKLASAIAAPVSLTVAETGETLNVDIGVSIGISLFPDDGNDLETLLSRADHSMYVAKKNNRPFSFYLEN